jgi:heme exporter protein CcmD
MNWNSLSEFAAMGGDAMYVWGSYAMAAAALAWEGTVLLQRRHIVLDELRQWVRETAAWQERSDAR